MKKFKSILVKLGIALAIPLFMAILPIESPAQTYSYKIIVARQKVPVPGGYIYQDICYHGPGLYGPSSPQQ